MASSWEAYVVLKTGFKEEGIFGCHKTNASLQNNITWLCLFEMKSILLRIIMLI